MLQGAQGGGGLGAGWGLCPSGSREGLVCFPSSRDRMLRGGRETDFLLQWIGWGGGWWLQFNPCLFLSSPKWNGGLGNHSKKLHKWEAQKVLGCWHQGDAVSLLSQFSHPQACLPGSGIPFYFEVCLFSGTGIAMTHMNTRDAKGEPYGTLHQVEAACGRQLQIWVL